MNNLRCVDKRQSDLGLMTVSEVPSCLEEHASKDYHDSLQYYVLKLERITRLDKVPTLDNNITSTFHTSIT